MISGNGVLQIVSVYRNDSGTYVCVADNGAGQPIRKEFNLEVKGEFSDFFCMWCFCIAIKTKLNSNFEKKSFDHFLIILKTIINLKF